MIDMEEKGSKLIEISFKQLQLSRISLIMLYVCSCRSLKESDIVSTIGCYRFIVKVSIQWSCIQIKIPNIRWLLTKWFDWGSCLKILYSHAIWDEHVFKLSTVNTQNSMINVEILWKSWTLKLMNSKLHQFLISRCIDAG